MKLVLLMIALSFFMVTSTVVAQEPALFPVRSDGRIGYIDRSGRLVIQPQFMHGWKFSEGLACVVDRSGKTGFIDSTGKYVIPPQFNSSYGCYDQFHEGFSGVCIGDKYRDGKLVNEEKCGYVDRAGKFTVIPDSDLAIDFAEGLAPVRKNGRMGYIDKSFKDVIPYKFKSAGRFYDGRARVYLFNGHHYYIDSAGKILFPEGGEFSEGKAFLKRRGKYGFIDTNGRTIVPFVYQNANHFGDGLGGVKLNGKWGFVNEKGKLVISPQFEAVSVFAEGLAAVKIKGKWGFVDKDGKVVIPPQFDEWTYYFENGLCEVHVGNKAGYINHQGVFVWPLSN